MVTLVSPAVLHISIHKQPWPIGSRCRIGSSTRPGLEKAFHSLPCYPGVSPYQLSGKGIGYIPVAIVGDTGFGL